MSIGSYIIYSCICDATKWTRSMYLSMGGARQSRRLHLDASHISLAGQRRDTVHVNHTYTSLDCDFMMSLLSMLLFIHHNLPAFFNSPHCIFSFYSMCMYVLFVVMIP